MEYKKESRKYSKQNIIIFLLILILVFLASYIIFDKLQEKKQNELLDAFRQGSQYGYEQAVVSLFTESQKCTPFPVYYQNQTINLIDVGCLAQTNK